MIRLLRRYVGKVNTFGYPLHPSVDFDMAMKHAQFQRVNYQQKGDK
jgi:hypothetical protein